jgi:hypothetical protein
MKLLLAQYAFGRMLMHVGCALRGGNARFHLAGCRRERVRLLSGGRRQRADGLR